MVFLASDDSIHITGIELFVDGGAAQSELPFLLAQLVTLALFVALGIVSTIRFRVAHA